MKEKTKSILVIFVCALLVVCIQAATILLDKAGVNAYNGVLMAFSYGLCLLMIKGNKKAGVITSLILMSINFLTLIRAFVFSHAIQVLPGAANCLFYIVTIIVLFNIGRQREKDTVTDLLTGLINRRGLYAYLKREIDDDKKFSVVYIDLVNFKVINDNYGHSYGDKLLIRVANILKDIVENNGTVARVGGYEFVVVLDSKINVEQTANYLLSSIRERISIANNDTVIDSYLTCYGGIASYPKDADDYEQLIKCADIAMYHAVKEKSAVACFFNSDMAKRVEREVEIGRLIKDGLENELFYFDYQPQYDIKTKEIRGFESLIRLRDSENTFISPGEFIPIAEKGELILKIDEYVLAHVMEQFKPIIDANPKMIVSVNISAKNIGSPDFFDKLEAVIQKVNFPHENLEIEITEYCLVQSIDTTIGMVRRLRDVGVKVSLDDFGTGYTSLNYLSKMPVNMLKIDKSLIDDIEIDSKRLDFVNAVISLGHLMGCDVIAEGVESDKQLTLLADKGVDYIQGYVLGKPVPFTTVKSLLGI